MQKNSISQYLYTTKNTFIFRPRILDCIRILKICKSHINKYQIPILSRKWDKIKEYKGIHNI